MPNANRPTGPGKPINEQHDLVTQQEGLDELQADEIEANGNPAALPDAATNARHAERTAHTKHDAAAGKG